MLVMNRLNMLLLSASRMLVGVFPLALTFMLAREASELAATVLSWYVLANMLAVFAKSGTDIIVSKQLVANLSRKFVVRLVAKMAVRIVAIVLVESLLLFSVMGLFDLGYLGIWEMLLVVLFAVLIALCWLFSPIFPFIKRRASIMLGVMWSLVYLPALSYFLIGDELIEYMAYGFFITGAFAGLIWAAVNVFVSLEKSDIPEQQLPAGRDSVSIDLWLSGGLTGGMPWAYQALTGIILPANAFLIFALVYRFSNFAQLAQVPVNYLFQKKLAASWALKDSFKFVKKMKRAQLMTLGLGLLTSIAVYPLVFVDNIVSLQVAFFAWFLGYLVISVGPVFIALHIMARSRVVLMVKSVGSILTLAFISFAAGLAPEHVAFVVIFIKFIERAYTYFHIRRFVLGSSVREVN